MKVHSMKIHLESDKIPFASFESLPENELLSQLELKPAVKEENAEDNGDLNKLQGRLKNHPLLKVEGQPMDTSFQRFYVGVKRKSSNEMHLFPASEFLVRVKMATDVDAAVAGEDKAFETKEEYLETIEKKNELIRTYAPAKKKRELKAALSSRVTDDRIESFDAAKQDMQKAHQEKKDALGAADGVEEPQHIRLLRQMLPKFNTKAVEPTEVFDLSQLFSNSLYKRIQKDSYYMSAVQSWVEGIANPNGKKEDGAAECGMFSKHMIQYYARVASGDSKKKAVNILLAGGMMELYMSLSGKKGKGSSYQTTDDACSSLDIPWEAADFLLKEFMEFDSKKSKYSLSKAAQSKLFLHLIVFMLVNSNSSPLDLSPLLKDKKTLGASDLQQTLKYAGLHASSSLKVKIDAPFKPVDPSTMGGARRRR